MRILLSSRWLGGAGGAERALYSLIRALSEEGYQLDVVATSHLGGPYSRVGPGVNVYTPQNWRWRGAGVHAGALGFLAQRLINPLRRHLLPRYDLYLQLSSGLDLSNAVKANLRLFNASGNKVSPEKAARYDAVALEAPDNLRFVNSGTSTVLLPPPVYELAEHSEAPEVDLPDNYYLTVFNPYGAVKGADDLARVIDSAPYPFVWCHSQATLDFTIPDELAKHPKIVHVEDAAPEQMRWLYEHCAGYVSVSRTEGFGWSIADALRYSPAVYSRSVGVLTFPDVSGLDIVQCNDQLQFDWDTDSVPLDRGPRYVNDIAPEEFKSRIRSLLAGYRSKRVKTGS